MVVVLRDRAGAVSAPAVLRERMFHAGIHKREDQESGGGGATRRNLVELHKGG